MTSSLILTVGFSTPKQSAIYSQASLRSLILTSMLAAINWDNEVTSLVVMRSFLSSLRLLLMPIRAKMRDSSRSALSLIAVTIAGLAPVCSALI